MEDLRRGRDLPKGDLAEIDCALRFEGERGMRGEGMVVVLEDMVVVFVPLRQILLSCKQEWLV